MLYRREEVQLRDVMFFKVDVLADIMKVVF